MKLDILDVDKFVNVNRLELVSDPIFFSSNGVPTEKGLFSTSIFGRPGSPDRSKKWGYIDLKQKYFHPAVYKALSQVFRKIDGIINNSIYFALSPTKELVLKELDEITTTEDEKRFKTGIEELEKIWDTINWGDKRGTTRDDKVVFLKIIPKEIAFITKYHVEPAMFRDVDLSTGKHVTDMPPINNLYSQLIAVAPPLPSGLQLLDGGRRLRAQSILLDIHTSNLDMIKGKKGSIQETVLGKYADYGVRTILSGPEISSSNTVDGQEVKFGEIGVPLYLLVNMFQPFVIARMNEIFKVIVERSEQLYILDKDGKESILEVPEKVRLQLGTDLYKKWISRFMRSQETRLEPLSVDIGGGKVFELPLYDSELKRKTTFTDLFFIIVERIAIQEKKHIMFTRYPVTDYQGCHFATPVILTTEKVTEVVVNGYTYKNYPDFSKKVRWIDSTRINNANTKSMGADYDGSYLAQ